MSDGPNDHHRPFLSMGTFADTRTAKPTAKVITVDMPQALGDAIAIGRNNAIAAAMTNGANWIMAMKIDDDRPMCDLTAIVSFRNVLYIRHQHPRPCHPFPKSTHWGTVCM